MFLQIVSSTPVWVWALLAFLIYRGLAARADRVVPFWNMFILPLVMLGLSLQDVLVRFGGAFALAVWLAFLALGTIAALKHARPDSVRADPLRRTVSLRGSPMPLMLMMTLFAVKYAAAVMLTLQPELLQMPAFVAVTCGFYGMFSGIFVGQLLHACTIYRAAVGRI